jgi:hypothetical protein
MHDFSLINILTKKYDEEQNRHKTQLKVNLSHYSYNLTVERFFKK